MPVREFANQKSLIDYAERNGLVYLWERMPAFARRQRMVSPLPAFTKRQQMLSADQYEIVDVRTPPRGVRRAMLFPKAILQAELAANAPLRERMGIKRERMRAKRAEKQKRYLSRKTGRPSCWEEAAPKGDASAQCVAEISRSRCQQQQQSSPRSATSVNPSAEAIFWTTFMFLDAAASMPMQAARRMKRGSAVRAFIHNWSHLGITDYQTPIP
jgi:hypothetical protein